MRAPAGLRFAPLGRAHHRWRSNDSLTARASRRDRSWRLERPKDGDFDATVGRGGRRDGRPHTVDPVRPIWDQPDAWTIDRYRRHGGYQALAKALGMQPAEVVSVVKDSGLRGRGGAGFGTGMKWGFVPQGEMPAPSLTTWSSMLTKSEPGACKDIPLLLTSALADRGAIVASYAIHANYAFIYVRGEVPQAIRRVNAAVREAYAAGFLGKNIQGSGFDLEVIVHSGAGAYICGEETAFWTHWKGPWAATPRPPFPAVAGLYASPTVVNNVETIASVPAIMVNGAEWYKSFGSEKSPGFKLFAVSGHVERPGIYEAPWEPRCGSYWSGPAACEPDTG